MKATPSELIEFLQEWDNSFLSYVGFVDDYLQTHSDMGNTAEGWVRVEDGNLKRFLDENLDKSRKENWTNEKFRDGWISALAHVRFNYLLPAPPKEPEPKTK